MATDNAAPRVDAEKIPPTFFEGFKLFTVEVRLYADDDRSVTIEMSDEQGIGTDKLSKFFAKLAPALRDDSTSPEILCGSCGRPLSEHPKEADGTTRRFGVVCPFSGKKEHKEEKPFA